MQSELEPLTDEISSGPLQMYHTTTAPRKGLIAARGERGRRQQAESRRGTRPSTFMWRLLLICGDGLLVGITVSSASFLLSALAPPLPATELWSVRLVWLCLVLLVWSSAAALVQAQNLRHAAQVLRGPGYALAALALTFLFLGGLAYPFIAGSTSSSLIGPACLSLALAAALLSVWRISFALCMGLARFRYQAVIVGLPASDGAALRELEAITYPRMRILGCICQQSAAGAYLPLPILGNGLMLRQLIRRGIVDMLIMNGDHRSCPELFEEALQAAQLGIPLLPLSVAHEHASEKIALAHMDDLWYVALRDEGAISPLYAFWHRALDIAFALCGLLVLGILFPFLAVLILRDSPGPLFFSQERLGYRGRAFRIYKFRSMHHAGNVGHSGWVAEGDTRVTRVGRIMRATHLDELPQVLNILRGEMSLIGPRPERPGYAAELGKSNMFYHCRLAIKPGLTGWAQVKHGYGGGEEDELLKLQYDLYYIKHRSPVLDSLIILKTIVEVLSSHGR